MMTREKLIDCAVKNNNCIYDNNSDKLIDNKSGIRINIDKFLIKVKEGLGQSFECIYDDHACCWNILKCTKCGTYIFEHYDEDYEANLQCPICTEYKTGFKYYTVKNIEEDENKKKEIDIYLEFAKIGREADERYEKRGGLHDWERTRKIRILDGKNNRIYIQFTGESFKDLKLEIDVYQRYNDDSFTGKHFIKIPLGYQSFYIQFIYRHLGKCHKDLRSKFYIGKAKENRCH